MTLWSQMWSAHFIPGMMTIDIVTYMISKKVDVQAACLNREVHSPKTAREKTESGICGWKSVVWRWHKLFVSLGTFGLNGGMGGSTLVLELRPRVANCLWEIDPKLVNKYFCSNLPHTSALKTSIETKKSCYDNIKFTSVLDSFYMGFRKTDWKFLLVNILITVLEDTFINV